MRGKIAKRLDGWKKAFLSRGDRLTLIQSVLSSIPIYYLSLFRTSSTVVAVEKLMRDFFWEEGDQLWRSFGGLGGHLLF